MTPPVIHLHFIENTFLSLPRSLYVQSLGALWLRQTQKRCPLGFPCGAESLIWPLACPSSDGPGPEGCDDAHLWATYGEDKTTSHLLQRMPNTLQLRGRKAEKAAGFSFINTSQLIDCFLNPHTAGVQAQFSSLELCFFKLHKGNVHIFVAASFVLVSFLNLFNIFQATSQPELNRANTRVSGTLLCVGSQIRLHGSS